MSKGLLAIPSDIIILVMYFLNAKDLAALECTCRELFHLVEEYGWTINLKSHPRPAFSLRKTFKLWSTKEQVRYSTITDHNWDNAEFIARPLSNRWAGKLQPILAINSSRLLLAAGNKIYSYSFIPSPSARAPSVHLECIYSTSNVVHPNLDITSIVCIPDDGLDRTVYVGYANGILERLVLPSVRDGHDGSVPVESLLKETFNFHADDLIESLSASSTHLLTLSASGNAVYFPLASPHPEPEFLHLNTRSWSAHLSTRSSSPYAAFGMSSMNPLVVHDILPSGLSPTPSTFLAPFIDTGRPSAVYAIDEAPPAAPWGASDQVLVSGWYNGVVNVYDLRAPTRPFSQTLGPPSLRPSLHFEDPWSDEPIYSLSCGGGSGAHIAAGSARHSVVAFFDVRAPAKGWSVHAPGNDSSPVYSVIVDGSRVFGANQSRGFVFDFGPGVQEDTYPAVSESLPTTRPGRGQRQPFGNLLKRSTKHPAGFYVTKYGHSRERGW
ncbi:unnamed protein product [Somion occarium]|uniref:F-box domain-containing protein n=1 Tax=Somion occarium TaxID=3059160 RepID=A0ABP1E106_9APHY